MRLLTCLPPHNRGLSIEEVSVLLDTSRLGDATAAVSGFEHRIEDNVGKRDGHGEVELVD